MKTRQSHSNGARIAACAALVAFAAAGFSVAQTTPAPAASPPPGAAPAQAGAKTFSQEQLDQLLAPVALYPDGLLAQVLMAATYPIEVVTAERWVKANAGLKDQALQDALEKQPWDASVKSLAAFPTVLTMMSEKLDWTQQLGDAFLAQQQDVAATVQNLRAKASKEGNLQTTKEQKVVTETVESKTIIKIEPANPQVVYVPTYNPTVVYGTWWYPAYPPYYYYPPGYVAAGAAWGFVAGVTAAAIWGNWNWGGGNVDIDVNRYNNFNRTNIQNNAQNRNWNHDASHRGAVPYKDQRVAQQYNRGASPGAANRDAYRGRDGGAQASRVDAGRGPGAGTMDRGAGAADRAGGAGTRAGSVSASPRDSYGGGAASSRDMSGTRNASAFNTGSASQTRAASSRGNASMGASRPSGGASRGGGGGRGGRR